MDLVYLMKKEMFRRNHGYRTIKSYASCLDTFLRWCKKEPKEVTKVDVRGYLTIFAAAIHLNSRLLTGDRHFSKMEHVEFLG